LLGDSYKSNSDYIDFSEHSMESAEENDQHNGVRKNHFEVLFVDNISEQEEGKLKHNLRILQTLMISSVMV
jgi:arginine decarboxylase